MTPRAGLPLAARVYAELADGRFHSGEALARSLAVSRSAVWKAAGSLRALGVTLHAVPNRGYRLPHAGEPLDAARIRELLRRDVRERLASLAVEWSLDSTNTALLGRPNPAPGRCEVLLAEVQTAGRGRRGRSWLAPPGGSLCLSLNWTFREVPRDLSALGLAVGVCTLRALAGLGAQGVALKWPNDLLHDGRKLGGILIDLRAEAAGPACVVIGIGLNVALGRDALERIAATGTAAADLHGAGLAGVARNALAAAVVGECVRGLVAFGDEGLRAFLEAWNAADALRGRTVHVSVPDGGARGVARGIDVHGALMVETAQGVKRFVSGDVTVRT